MGKKPVMALAGLCLASTALIGCCGDRCYNRQQPAYHASPTFSNNPTGQNPASNPPSGAQPGLGMPGTPVGGMQPGLGGVQPLSGGTTPPGGTPSALSGLGQPGGALPASNNTGLQQPIMGNGSTPGLPGRGADGLGNGGGFGRPMDDPGMSGPTPPAAPAVVPQRTSSFGGPAAGFGGPGSLPAPGSFPGTSMSNHDPMLENPPPIVPDRTGSQVNSPRPLGVPTPPINPAVMTPGSGDAP
jgi:hypothetical protein